MRAFRNQQITNWMQLQAMIQCITFVGESITMAVANKPGPSPDKLNELLANLRGLIFPDLAEEKEERAKKVMKIMEEEIGKGPFKVEGMVYTKPKR